MPWFKVDDGLHAHRKAARAGTEAMGLWVMAGSWSADQLSDGFVPDYIALKLDPKAKAHAARLVAAGFWYASERDGDSGWQFHDWDAHQPSAKTTLEKRAEAKDRMQRLRDARRANGTRGSREGAPERSDGVRANGARTFADHSEEVRSAPTRPDPTRKNHVVKTEGNGVEAVRARADARGYVPDSPPTMTESKKPAPTPKPRLRCPEGHGEQLWDCFRCKQGHGDARFYADPDHWPAEYRSSRFIKPDFDALVAYRRATA